MLPWNILKQEFTLTQDDDVQSSHRANQATSLQYSFFHLQQWRLPPPCALIDDRAVPQIGEQRPSLRGGAY
jgi:hypothetical protein